MLAGPAHTHQLHACGSRGQAELQLNTLTWCWARKLTRSSCPGSRRTVRLQRSMTSKPSLWASCTRYLQQQAGGTQSCMTAPDHLTCDPTSTPRASAV